MEIAYTTILSEDYIVAFGPNIVDQIRVTLKAEVVVSDLFFDFYYRIYHLNVLTMFCILSY